MIMFSQRVASDSVADGRLTLELDKRVRARFRASLDDGRDVGVTLERGDGLAIGDKLISECGLIIEIAGARESLSVVRTDNELLFARACYHLGNRHVQLQIGESYLAYQHDHVLDGMLEQLGLQVTAEQREFDPENGAYSSGHGLSQNHGHDHDHERKHVRHENTQKQVHHK